MIRYQGQKASRVTQPPFQDPKLLALPASGYPVPAQGAPPVLALVPAESLALALMPAESLALVLELAQASLPALELAPGFLLEPGTGRRAQPLFHSPVKSPSLVHTPWKKPGQ